VLAATRIAWARPRRELLLLALVALAALSPVNVATPQDGSRLCLADAIVHGRLSADACLSDVFDRSSHDGHLYSDKAPGLAVLEIPAAEAVDVGANPQVWGSHDLRLWGARLLSVGICFLLCTFLVGRISEGLAPGYGALALVGFGLGTLVEPLAATGFGEDATAAFLFAAFVLAWRRRLFSAGLVAGAAVLVDYGAALAVVVLAVYVAVVARRGLLRFVAGGLPAALLLAGYDWAAFGAPWHLSYSYIDNLYASAQRGGFFGIGTPHLAASYEVFAGPGGLLVASPIVVMAAAGLWLLARERPAEAVVCAVTAAVYILLDCGYFLPYGGVSPGPRFLVPGLPFLALGIGPAARRWPRATVTSAVVSVVTMTAITLEWPSNAVLRQTVWGELVRVPAELGSSRFVHSLSHNLVGAAGLGSAWGAGLVTLAAVAALVVSLRSLPWAEIRTRPVLQRRGRRLLAMVGGFAGLYLVGGADVSAVFGYPYGNRTEGVASQVVDISTSISAQPPIATVGGYVNYVVTVDYQGDEVAQDLVLTVRLSGGMRLAGYPHYTIGSGCSYGSTFVCRLDYLPAGHSTQVDFGAQMLTASPQTVSASTSSDGVVGYNHPSLTVKVGQ
jgi:hypothetical protein